MYINVKGNVFKNKHVAMKDIHKSKVDKARGKTFSVQFEARREKNKVFRKRKFARIEKIIIAAVTRELSHQWGHERDKWIIWYS